ncbi:hypothetical protein GOV07_05400 [Candidatus Woesearchaeota archaeon]|nr:hypothetical protein [Candidatus Woesearchaeota archaeon]
MRFNKKASLEIGVNTIVILVIAMTLLGLGVVFVRNLFDKVGGTVDIIEPGDISSPPTSDKPIKLVPSTISVKGGKDKSVEVLVYNKKGTQNFDITFGACSSGITPYIESIPDVEIEQGAYKGFKVLVYAAEANGAGDGPDMDKKMAPKRHICQIISTGKAASDPAVYTEQFIMDVTA